MGMMVLSHVEIPHFSVVYLGLESLRRRHDPATRPGTGAHWGHSLIVLGEEWWDTSKEKDKRRMETGEDEDK